VTELELDESVNTLSRWMAHYLAELISAAETASEAQKHDLEQRCADTIIKLWANRDTFPDGMRPFKNFEPVFRALEKLDPERDGAFSTFINDLHILRSAQAIAVLPDNGRAPREEHSKSTGLTNDVYFWISHILNFDEISRDSINYAIRKTVELAQDEKTKHYLDLALSINQDDSDLSVLDNLQKYLGDEIEAEILLEKTNKIDQAIDLLNLQKEEISQQIEEMKKPRAEQ
jgi:hypothetical protein